MASTGFQKQLKHEWIEDWTGAGSHHKRLKTGKQEISHGGIGIPKDQTGDKVVFQERECAFGKKNQSACGTDHTENVSSMASFGKVVKTCTSQ